MKRLLFVLVVAVAACSSATPSTAGGGGAVRSDRCSPAAGALLAAISGGLTVDGGGTLASGYVVKSNDFAKVWIVAAEINGRGMEGKGQIGVWATNDPSGSGSIFAVDSMANEFSDWADGRTTDAHFSLVDDGVSVAQACAAS